VAAFSADGTILFTNHSSLKQVWGAREGRQLWGWDDASPSQDEDYRSGEVRVSFDGRFLAEVAVDRLLIREAASRRIIHSVPHRGLEDDRPISEGPFRTDPFAFSPVTWQLAAVDPDDNILIWDLPTLFRRQGEATSSLEDLWRDLASRDAARAQRAVWRLVAAEGADAFLARRLRPVVSVPASRRNPPLLALNSRDVLNRHRAERELAAMGEAVRDDLLRLYRGPGDLEESMRAGRLLHGCGPSSPEGLREHRSVLVLEARGTRGARDLLRRLAAGAPTARLTGEAKAALARLSRPAKPNLRMLLDDLRDAVRSFVAPAPPPERPRERRI
jgi:hypothetical protein